MTRVFLAAEAGSPPDPLTQRGLAAAASSAWADPAFRSHEGRRSLAMLQAAAASVATSVSAPGARVSFVPGLDSALRFAASHTGTGPVVCSAVERKSVLAVADQRRGADGPPPVSVDEFGRVDIDEVALALTSTGAGVVVTQVGNPEVGTLQPVADLYALCQAAAVPLVLDATMAAGRTWLPESWDVLVLDARSWAGGNDVAAVVVKQGVNFAESALAGVVTELPLGAPEVPACAAAALALEARTEASSLGIADESARRLTTGLRGALSQLPAVMVHGHPEERLPHVVGFSALYIDAEALLLELDRQGIAVASGSACAVDSGEPSHVLAAMGGLTSGNVRASLPLTASQADIDALLRTLPHAMAELREAAGL